MRMHVAVAVATWNRFHLTRGSNQRPHGESNSVSLPQHPAVAYPFLVRSMRTLARFLLALALTVSCSHIARASHDQYGELTVNDMVVVTFAFDFHRDGSIHNVRVWRCSNPKDLSLANGALTPEEKATGCRIVAATQMKARPDELGKTSYTYLIFDKRIRKYVEKRVPVKT